MESRTTCWEMEQNFNTDENDNNNYTWYNPVASNILEKFQNDLNSLNCVIDEIPVNINYINVCVFVFDSNFHNLITDC